MTDDARLVRQFERALERAEAIRKRRAIVRAGALAAVATLAVALIVHFSRSHAAPLAFGLEGTTIESDGAETMTLADGTRLGIGAHTHADFRAARPDLVRIALDRGEMDFDVTHVEGRAFEVVCGPRTVKVIGTHFRVLADGPRFSVSVERGRVRVDAPDGAVELGPGESFARGFDAAPIIASSVPEPLLPTPVPSTAPSPVHTVESASDVFARAQSARLAGRTAEAARAYDELRLHHRSDARAGLAAFELGRIRLDDLGDPAGAAEAFQDAVTLSPSASYREDAEARRVEALDATGDKSCVAARDAYLARYAQGVFRASVSKRCVAPLPSP
jgi:hypothetical protein